MYKLTLTRAERKAIDWIAHRYSNGDELAYLLYVECDCGFIEWWDDHDMTFNIPEWVAWKIRENAEQEDGFWPCFAHELAHKMQAFIDKIV